MKRQNAQSVQTSPQNIRYSFVLPKDTMKRFEEVCNEIDLETDDLLEIALEVFLHSKVWHSLDRKEMGRRQDC